MAVSGKYYFFILILNFFSLFLIFFNKSVIKKYLPTYPPGVRWQQTIFFKNGLIQAEQAQNLFALGNILLITGHLLTLKAPPPTVTVPCVGPGRGHL